MCVTGRKEYRNPLAEHTISCTGAIIFITWKSKKLYQGHLILPDLQLTVTVVNCRENIYAGAPEVYNIPLSGVIRLRFPGVYLTYYVIVTFYQNFKPTLHFFAICQKPHIGINFLTLLN